MPLPQSEDDSDDVLYNMYLSSMRRRQTDTIPPETDDNSNSNSNNNNNNNNNSTSRQDTGNSITLRSNRAQRVATQILQNLLYMDYLFIVITLPITLYTLINAGIYMVTFDYQNASTDQPSPYYTNDMMARVYGYIAYGSVILTSTRGNNNNNNSDNNNIDMISITFNLQISGLLAKLHNVSVHYTEPLLILFLRSFQCDDKTHLIEQFTRSQWMRAYTLVVKTLTCSIYLTYSLLGALYMIGTNLFFLLCLFLNVLRRYRPVIKVVLGRQ